MFWGKGKILAVQKSGEHVIRIQGLVLRGCCLEKVLSGKEIEKKGKKNELQKRKTFMASSFESSKSVVGKRFDVTGSRAINEPRLPYTRLRVGGRELVKALLSHCIWNCNSNKNLLDQMERISTDNKNLNKTECSSLGIYRS